MAACRHLATAARVKDPVARSGVFDWQGEQHIGGQRNFIYCFPKSSKGEDHTMKKVLSIAGSDCSGGAGIQADLKTFSAHGVYGMSVIVSVVAENTDRVIGIQDISADMIGKQIDAVFEDIGVDAVKVGMLSTPDCMEEVAGKLKYYHPANIVVDPVMYAKNGCPLMEPAAIETLIGTVIPIADVLTPNIPEAEKITGGRIRTLADMEDRKSVV